MTGERRRLPRSGLLGGLYGRVTQARRGWYARNPDRRRRLQHPVVSVGNLISGGSGKTPVVAAIARMLRDRGERPAILTRGYGRREHVDGVLVVSDGHRVLEPVTRSGDEPQLLARTLRDVPVLVSADRYIGGLFAARQFGVTVSILDDGFQHVQLERDVDLLLASPADLDERVLPWGPLREPLGAARSADALLVAGADDEVMQVAHALGHASAFRIVPRYLPAHSAAAGSADSHDAVLPARALAVAGIARPRRFFDALRALGWDVAGEVAFPDHHWFTASDIQTIERAVRDCGASTIVTTEKDAVRLPAMNAAIPVAVLPMVVAIEPANIFESWLLGRIRLRVAGVAEQADGAPRP